MMKQQLRALALTGLGAVLTMSAARAEDGGFVGRWHWNAKASTAVQGEPVPSEVTTTIVNAEPGHVKWTVHIVDHRGQPRTEAYDGPADGQPRAIEGAGDGTMGAFTLAAGVLRATFHGPKGETDTLSCVVAPDQKSLRCDGMLRDAQGHTETYLDVYDRL